MFVPDGLNELCHGIDPYNATGQDERNAVTEPFGLLNVMGGEKNCGSFLMKIGYQLAQLTGTGHINAGGGFI
ncbi:hypothetical protein MTBBW1_610010 [Desulfamplus magnetovallimortis]|uniref:Uncharacterized protein n=1 Tax=Desulfamplus magnetovallimortis TaxID=1246637 RepID=A0A1W1HIS0_9BACT|nr:hypothetical protein MTBBW1_610010 [Desulfamplus magnetovallimortis]